MVIAGRAPWLRAVARRRDEIVSLLSELVSAPSEVGTSGDATQHILGRYLEAAGYRVDYTTNDPAQHVLHSEYTPPPPGEPPVNVVATPPGAMRRPLAFLAHIDTEPARGCRTAAPALSVREGRAYGLGAADDKSGVAAAAVAAVMLCELREPAPVVMSVHAKGGGARGTLPMFARARDLGAVLYVHPAETGRGMTEIKHATRGVLDLILRIDGWHGPFREIGTPESARFADGGDALRTALLLIERLKQGPFRACDVNVGHVVAGERAGLVPAQCDVELRVLFDTPMTVSVLLAAAEAEFDRYKHDLASPSGTFGIRVAGVPFQANPASTNWDSPFCRVARDAVAGITRALPVPYTAHLASDLRFPRLMLGVPAVGLGCVAGGFYGPDEWVDLDDLLRLVAVLVAIGQRWNDLEE